MTHVCHALRIDIYSRQKQIKSTAQVDYLLREHLRLLRTKRIGILFKTRTYLRRLDQE